VASLLLVVAPTVALELFDFEPPYLVDDDRTLKDHCLILVDGEWHAFYIRGESDTGTSTEDELGHAVAPNLRNWTILSPAVTAGPEPWDSRNTWAPHVIPTPGGGSGYMMFYTGANNSVVQRMGLATTLNPFLVNWNKYLNNPLAEPDSVVYEWESDLSFSSFRDPFVFEHGGNLHVLNTAVVRDTTLAAGRRGAIHHLAGPTFNTLVDVGPLALHNGPDNAAWHEIESVQLREVGDYWHLFYTETNVQGVQHLRSADFDSGWDFSAPTLIDIGTAAELTPIPGLPRRFHFTRHIATPHAGSGALFWVIRADTLWFQSNDSPVVLRTKALKEDWPVQLGTAFLGAPTFGDNPAERSEAPVGEHLTAPVERNVQFGGTISHTHSGHEDFPDLGDSALHVARTQVRGHVRFKVGPYATIGGEANYSHFELSEPNSSGTPPVTRHSTFGIGPVFSFHVGPEKSDLSFGFSGALQLQNVPWTTWERTTPPSITDWGFDEADHEVAADGEDLMLLTRISGAMNYRIWRGLSLHTGLSFQNHVANIGFDDQDREGSTLTANDLGIVPYVGAHFVTDEGFYVLAQGYTPIGYEQLRGVQMGGMLQIGADLQ